MILGYSFVYLQLFYRPINSWTLLFRPNTAGQKSQLTGVSDTSSCFGLDKDRASSLPSYHRFLSLYSPPHHHYYVLVLLLLSAVLLDYLTFCFASVSSVGCFNSTPVPPAPPGVCVCVCVRVLSGCVPH